MNKKQKNRLFLILFIASVGIAIISLITYALRQNISLYYTPTQLSNREAPLNRIIRVGGMVAQHTLMQHADKLDVEFAITDYSHRVIVHYHGVLPDLFREGQGIVVKGKLNDWHTMEAIEVLAKHDENYMPKEVKDSLTKRGQSA
jgi:cytochrome c-type biogenesis protein CcmE